MRKEFLGLRLDRRLRWRRSALPGTLKRRHTTGEPTKEESDGMEEDLKGRRRGGTKRVTTRRLGTSILMLLIAGALLFPTPRLLPRLYAQTPITVERDKDKTVYTIGSNSQIKQEEAAEREKAWEMLKNSGVVVDERTNRGQGQSERPSPKDGRDNR